MKKHHEEVELANRLLRKSFGFFYKGDTNFWMGFSGMDYLEKTDNLYMIVRNFGLLVNVAGYLGGEDIRADGSVIVVHHRYEKKAVKYANLYKQITGKEGKVV